MNLAEVSVRRRKKFKVTIDSKHNLQIALNLLARNFKVAAPNRAWVSDITYVWTSEGWLYLTVVLDLFHGETVGWSMSNRIYKQLVLDTLQMGIWHRHPTPGLIFHSDRGSQDYSHDFLKMLKTHKMLPMYDRKGNC